MVVIVLSALNRSVIPTTATITNQPDDAVAEFQISLEDFEDMFQVEGIDNLGDNVDSAIVPIKYFVNTTTHATLTPRTRTAWAWPLAAFNPGFAQVVANAATTVDGTGVQLDDTELPVVADYIRSLSKGMFGTPHLTYLITNDFTVQKDVVTKLKAAVATIKTSFTSLDKYSATTTTYADIKTDGEGGPKYTDNTHTATSNICRELFLGLLKQAPDRFADTTYLSGVKYTLPFEDGDRITFKVTLDNSAQYGISTVPASGTTPAIGSVGWASGQIPNRVYTIILILKTAPTNATSAAIASRFTTAEIPAVGEVSAVPAFSPFAS